MGILRILLGVAFILLVTSCTVVQSSSAAFSISAIGQQLDAVDESGEIPVYNFEMQVGQEVTFVSQGMVMPRGRPAQPSKPDAGAWLFDDTVFELRPHNGNQFDNTQIPITLKALVTASGRTHVRFVGKILGYDRKYDVLVAVNN